MPLVYDKHDQQVALEDELRNLAGTLDRLRSEVGVLLSAVPEAPGGVAGVPVVLQHALLSAFHADTIAAAVVAGDLIVAEKTPKWTRLPLGAASRFLRVNGAGDAIEWAELGTHAAQHMSAGSDPIRIDELKEGTAVATLDTSITRHGLCPQLPDDVTKFLNGTGGWTVPAGGGGAPTTVSYLVLGLDGTLTHERRFVPGDGLDAVDGGANGDYTAKVDLYGTNPGLEIDSAKLRTKTDETTIERAAGGLQVKDLGISGAKLAADAVNSQSKIADDVVQPEHLHDDVRRQDFGWHVIKPEIGEIFIRPISRGSTGCSITLKKVYASSQTNCTIMLRRETYDSEPWLDTGATALFASNQSVTSAGVDLTSALQNHSAIDVATKPVCFQLEMESGAPEDLLVVVEYEVDAT